MKEETPTERLHRFLEETNHNLGKAIDLQIAWAKEHNCMNPVICCNDEREAAYEREILEWKRTHGYFKKKKHWFDGLSDDEILERLSREAKEAMDKNGQQEKE